MAGEPKIFTKNYVHEDDVFSISHGSAEFPNAYDRDVISQFIATGSELDSTTVTAEIVFMDGVDAVDRDIDTIMLLNHNLKAWKLEYWDGAAWAAIPGVTFTVNAEANQVISFTKVNTTKVLLTATSTIVADATKKIGELIICALTLQFGNDLSSYAETHAEMVSEYEMIDGTVERAVTKWTANRFSKYGCRWEVSAISVTERDALFAVKEDTAPFLWQPESIQRPYRVFFVQWSSGWAEEYYTTIKTTGYNIKGTFKEV